MGLNRNHYPKLSPEGERRALSCPPALPTRTIKVKSPPYRDSKGSPGTLDAGKSQLNCFESLYSCKGQAPGTVVESSDPGPTVTLCDLCQVEEGKERVHSLWEGEGKWQES